jgi:Protein of unknown function (DUF2799)
MAEGKEWNMNLRCASLLLLLSALAVSACSSMSPEECAATDWAAVGYEDGARGLPSDHFGTHRKACAKHGVTADFAAYQEGRDEGLVEFCQPGRGYNLGVNGGRYNGVCDVALEEEFLDAYKSGHQLYTLRANVYNANAQIAAREQEQENIRAQIRNREARLISIEPTPQERILLLADIKDLAERAGQIQTEIAVLIDERARHETALAEYESSVAAYDY